ncbi:MULTISPECIES: DUF441 family protein [unclassified Candidatus Frackibacter]|uniref:DUF441 family protein n=1 Tax=unclassified Candidatus Frackibacter TaxID=2648818 RepID=UPI000882770A|nr:MULTISPECIES: DUF441 family protein [unclassified Candidatus Frackibacter]SDC61468.1 Uncharacterized membrane protein, DUF441 family [Candidatus Frackibacter sp. WG11]SEM75275.1 Uncharacterized membrane protein, DUF441 family [Candidatus Frackibacter sp. WG12]SFL86956.1 Uncharacterized membrane protein, DUF441 family [Candidatus Frackibacter sp. WG13]
MGNGYILIFIIFFLGILAKSNILSLAAVILFLLKVLKLKLVFPILEKQGLDLGLLFLILAVLAPLVTDVKALTDLVNIFKSPLGLLALTGGLLATKLNGMGLNLLENQPQLIVGMVIGSLIGIIFLDGIPVGPLMAGGITAFFLRIVQIIIS